ncbi:unnamed protein product [Symbiodinium necroappetens]|uniref:Uncharacterized protein n=1 Tax=Symbiodinium necroappetens TaxID=1628268 RepID=A0A812KXG2_9DINO|nr:unnamed protein product [Symbiodinium necroappetens]
MILFLLCFVPVGALRPFSTRSELRAAYVKWADGRRDELAATYGEIGRWNVSAVTSMRGLFQDCWYFKEDIRSWNTSAVTDMGYMFSRAEAFNHPTGSWDTSAVTDMGHMFDGAEAFNQPIGSWDTSAVTDMGHMFDGALAFNQPIVCWETSAVTYMRYMFNCARSFNQPIGSWDASAVTDMGFMFYLADTFNQPIGSWNTSAVTDMGHMFDGAEDMCNVLLAKDREGQGLCGLTVMICSRSSGVRTATRIDFICLSRRHADARSRQTLTETRAPHDSHREGTYHRPVVASIPGTPRRHAQVKPTKEFAKMRAALRLEVLRPHTASSFSATTLRQAVRQASNMQEAIQALNAQAYTIAKNQVVDSGAVAKLSHDTRWRSFADQMWGHYYSMKRAREATLANMFRTWYHETRFQAMSKLARQHAQRRKRELLQDFLGGAHEAYLRDEYYDKLFHDDSFRPEPMQVVTGVLTEKAQKENSTFYRPYPVFAYLPDRSTADCLLQIFGHIREAQGLKVSAEKSAALITMSGGANTRLYFACVWPMATYGVLEAGITAQGARSLHGMTMRHLRIIARSPVHITHEDNERFSLGSTERATCPLRFDPDKLDEQGGLIHDSDIIQLMEQAQIITTVFTSTSISINSSIASIIVLFESKTPPSMVSFKQRLGKVTLVLMTGLVWLIPIEDVESNDIILFDVFESAETFMMAETLPAGTTISWADDDESTLMWLRAADILREHAPEAYKCWVGLGLDNCEGAQSKGLQSSLRGLADQKHCTTILCQEARKTVWVAGLMSFLLAAAILGRLSKMTCHGLLCQPAPPLKAAAQPNAQVSMLPKVAEAPTHLAQCPDKRIKAYKASPMPSATGSSCLELVGDMAMTTCHTRNIRTLFQRVHLLSGLSSLSPAQCVITGKAVFSWTASEAYISLAGELLL